MAAVAFAFAGPMVWGQVREKVVVGALPFVSSAPLFLAQEKGFYAREGLEVEFKFFRAAQPVALATTTGDVDFGATGLTAGFYNLASHGALKIIAAQSRVEPGYRFIAYCVSQKAWTDGFRSLDDFAGRSVGITQQGSTFHYMVGMLADKRGFPVSGVRMVSLESVPNMIAALRGGRVDAVLLPAHLAQPLEEEGVTHILGWVGDETPWPLGALFTSTRNLDSRRSVVEKFLRAYRDAAEVYAEAFLRTDEAGLRILGEEARSLAAVLQTYVPASISEILAGSPYIDRGVTIEASDIRPQLSWFQARNLVDRRLEASTLIEAGILNEAGATLTE